MTIYSLTTFTFLIAPKPMKFMSVGFLDYDLQRHIIENMLGELPKVDDTDEQHEDKDDDDALNDDNLDVVLEQCKHCHQFGHCELQCFDLQSCNICGKINHLA